MSLAPICTHRDLQYEAQVDALLPAAVSFANIECGAEPPPLMSREVWSVRWDRVYLDAVDRICREKGVR